MESSKLRTTAIVFFLICTIALSSPTNSTQSTSTDKLKTMILEKTQDILNLSAFQAVDLSKRFLSIFNEIENGIDQVLQKAEEGKQFIEQH